MDWSERGNFSWDVSLGINVTDFFRLEKDVVSKVYDLEMIALEKRRELLGWKEPRVEDMYFSFSGFVLSQLTYTAIICDLIDAYEYLEDEIEEIKSKQKDDGYIFGDEYDQVIERELLENE
jgi:hypothetical protein